MSSQQQPSAAALLAWYDRHRRVLPWRALPGETADPYKVWLSEIMLQQTTVMAVKPYFLAFTERFPTVHALADAPTEDIMRLWAGLGYYSRARNLHACARMVVAGFQSAFPAAEEDLLKLPGIGPYTAAAISSIAFGRRAVVVDGNVERVISRLYLVEEPLPQAKPLIRMHADRLTPHTRPGDFAQAMMDLGATICSPRKPSCAICPFLGSCLGQRAGSPETYPRKAPKGDKPLRRGSTFVAIREDGAILVRTRPPKGLLGGMTEVPGTDWSATTARRVDAVGAPFAANWQLVPEAVRHVFTHFPLELSVFVARVSQTTSAPVGMTWLAAEDIPREAFPNLFRKVLKAALD
jgi:A/G-specific adenine glycosylase